MTPQERLANLLETAETPTNKQIIVADIVDAVGDDATRIVLGTMKAAAENDPLLQAACTAFHTVGISFSPPARQAMIDQLAQVGQWPDEVRDAIKSLGVIKQPRWQVEGYETEPTLEQVTEELRLAEVTEWTETKIQQVNAAMRLAAAVEGATVDDVKNAAIGELS